MSKVNRKEHCNDGTDESNNTADEEDGWRVNFSKCDGCDEGASFAQESTHTVKSATELGGVGLCCDL